MFWSCGFALSKSGGDLQSGSNDSKSRGNESKSTDGSSNHLDSSIEVSNAVNLNLEVLLGSGITLPDLNPVVNVLSITDSKAYLLSECGMLKEVAEILVVVSLSGWVRGKMVINIGLLSAELNTSSRNDLFITSPKSRELTPLGIISNWNDLPSSAATAWAGWVILAGLRCNSSHEQSRTNLHHFFISFLYLSIIKF